MRKLFLLLGIVGVVLCMGCRVEAGTLEPFNQEKFDAIGERVLQQMYKDVSTLTFKDLSFGSSQQKIRAKAGLPADQFSCSNHIVLCYENKDTTSLIALKNNKMVAYMTMGMKSYTKVRVQSILGLSSMEKLAGCIPALPYSSGKDQGNNVHICWADDCMWFYAVGESDVACKTIMAVLGARALGGELDVASI